MGIVAPLIKKSKKWYFAPSGDPRWYQLLFQLSFLLVGVGVFDFSISPMQVVSTFASAILAQWLCLRAIGRPEFGYKSALISAFGVSLLLRSNVGWVHPAAAAIAIVSKFAIRTREGHVFNPANVGIALALLFFPSTWLSPGQWGKDWILMGWFLTLGLAVVGKVHRSDVSWTFLGTYLGLFAARVAWLGQAWAVWLHRFTDGSLLLFTFFMISDPKTIPRARTGRVVHAAFTAMVAFIWQFGWFRTNGLIWALLMTTLAVPLWNRVWPGKVFEWPSARLKEAA